MGWKTHIRIAAFALALVPHLTAQTNDAVAVKAGADDDYVRAKFGEKGAKTRSDAYIFAQGSYFGGALRDASLEHAQFIDIAHTLAPELAKQSFFPTGDSKRADILIVVHWGITYVEEDPSHGQLDTQKLMSAVTASRANASSRGIADPSAVNTDLNVLAANAQQNSGGPASNAELLGFSDELRKEEYRSRAVASGTTDMDRELRIDASDERYFVILMAYDLKSLRATEHGRKPKLLWSTHFSMRAIGRNFTSALPFMSKVAANYFGRNADGLILDARPDHLGSVQIGEATTVEEKKN